MLIQKGGAVYIIANKRFTVLYTGVTSNLRNRILQHKTRFYKNSFTDLNNCNILLWYELHNNIREAIAREKKIKGRSRIRKAELINKMNPEWEDLWEIDVKNW